MIGRRAFVLGAGSAALVLPGEGAVAGGAESLLEKAVKRAGGRRLLSRVRSLSWEGEAVLHGAETPLKIGVSTTVAPFRWARSETWLTAQGKSSARTMVITPADGWVTRGTATTHLPARVAAYERAQYAIYGVMLLEPLMELGVGLRTLPKERGMRRLEVMHRLAPRTTLFFDRNERLAEAENVIPSHEGEGEVAQRFVFSEAAVAAPFRWPERMQILQGGKPWFELAFHRFTAEL
jgi:hypothetical protein